jgi:hypothetical protein
MQISGEKDLENSWGKQDYWKLNNGFTVIVEYSPHYGEYISQIFNSKIRYCACDGIEKFPDWARAWIEPIAPGHWQTIMKPKFLKLWQNRSIDTKKAISKYLEKARQSDFAREQSRESVFTRHIESIVDTDN